MFLYSCRNISDKFFPIDSDKWIYYYAYWVPVWLPKWNTSHTNWLKAVNCGDISTVLSVANQTYQEGPSVPSVAYDGVVWNFICIIGYRWPDAAIKRAHCYSGYWLTLPEHCLSIFIKYSLLVSILFYKSYLHNICVVFIRNLTYSLIIISGFMKSC